MCNTDAEWHLEVVAHTERLLIVATGELGDANEAHLLVHRVMLNAMTDMLGPSSRNQLDTALGRALCDHHAQAA
jgi:hypothetical protein